MRMVLRAMAAILLCAWLLPAAAVQAQALPRGSYLRTCHHVGVTRHATLFATCRRIDGRWRRTSLHRVDRCVGDISNRDGRLFCGYGG